MYKVVTVVLLAALAAGCANGGDEASTTEATTSSPTTTTSVDPAAASKAAEAERALKERVTNRLLEIEAEAAAAPTLSEQLGVLVTEYCNLQGPLYDHDAYRATGGQFEREVVEGLKRRYSKIWAAGNGWNSPLYAASQQQGPGTCPLPPLAPRPTPKG